MLADVLEMVDSWPAKRCAVGVTDDERTVAVRGRSDWRFDLASVTKLLTTMAVLLATEEGIVSLDEPAGPPGSTVRHLLAHTSGYSLTSAEPIAPPARRRIYSNVGIERAAALVEQRAGIPFAEYLSQGVLDPLAMTGTRLLGSPAYAGRSSVDDLLALGRELLAPRLLAPDTLACATTVQFPGLRGVLPGFGRQDPCDWGLGFELRGTKHPHWTATTGSPRTFGHFGQTGTFLWVDPEAGLATAFLSNLPFDDWARDRWPALSDAILTTPR